MLIDCCIIETIKGQSTQHSKDELTRAVNRDVMAADLNSDAYFYGVIKTKNRFQYHPNFLCHLDQLKFI